MRPLLPPDSSSESRPFLHKEIPYRGFTMIELLVAIALLATLAALLMAGIGKVRNVGAAAQCSANLKGIGLAFHSYLNDNDQRFPPSREQNMVDSKGVKTQADFIHYHLGPYIPDPRSKMKNDNAEYKTAGVYWCPGDRERSIKIAHFSYGFNYRLGGNNAISHLWDSPSSPNPDYNPALASIRAVSNPGHIILAIDHIHLGSTSLNGGVDQSSWPLAKGSALTPSPAISKQVQFDRHGRKANALLLDGSVQILSVDDLRETRGEWIIPSI